VDKPSAVTVAVGGAAAQPARVTGQTPTGPWRFQREAEFPVGDTTLTITATDGSGNVRTQSYTVTVSDTETRTLAYDATGNLLTKTWLNTGTAYRRETYGWDAENQLKSWDDRTLPAATITASATWLYDGLGRRVKEHTVVVAAVTDRNTVWDGLEMVQWQNLDGTVQRNLYASGEQTRAGAVTTSLVYTTDHLGSVRGWYNPADSTSGSAEFAAYGTRTITANTTGLIPARSFTGHYQHEASGLTLAPYRAYDAELGRWLSRDPIGEEGGINLYGYVGNRPTILIDPLGFAGYWSEVGDSMSGISAGMLEGAFGWLIGGLEISDNALDTLDINTANGYRFGRVLGTIGGLLAPAAKGGGGGTSCPKSTGRAAARTPFPKPKSPNQLKVANSMTGSASEAQALKNSIPQAERELWAKHFEAVAARTKSEAGARLNAERARWLRGERDTPPGNINDYK
jgi:RHS repeat-associated protein